jgi:hypothetical protein
MKINSILAALLLIAAHAIPVSAQEFSTVSPSALNLTLAQGESTTETVSLTIHPFCFRPFLVDVIGSTLDALVANTSGTILNGCGGDTSNFDVMITGTGQPQSFDLQFVDAEFGGVIASIPVTITPPLARSCTVELGLSMRRGTLVMDLTLATSEPANFNLFLNALDQTYPLLKAPAPLPVISPPRSLSLNLPGIPDIGTVGILATITTPRDGIRCSAWQVVDTAPVQ